MRRRSSQLKTGSKSIEKPSRLIAIDSDGTTLVSSSALKNKTLLTASDEEEHISAKTCDSYEYARDMSRIMPDIALSETSVNPFVKLTFLNKHQKLKVSSTNLLACAYSSSSIYLCVMIRIYLIYCL